MSREPLPPTPRDGQRGRWMRGVESIERDTEAARLRSRGWSWQRISDELGYGGRGNVHRAVSRLLQEIPVEAVTELRTTMREQLTGLYAKAMDLVDSEYVKINSGSVVYGHDGEPMADLEPVRRAVETAAKLLSQLAALDGLNAPVKVATEAATTVRHEIVGVDVSQL